MNKEIIKGRWNEIKGKVKQKWGKVTDDDVMRMRGTYEELAGTLQKRYGYQKEKAEDEIQAFIDENDLDEDQR